MAGGMSKIISNEIKTFSELDASKLQFDISLGAQGAHATYFFFRNGLKREDQVSFQCPCGRLGVLPKGELKNPTFKKFIKDGLLLCYECGSYNIELLAPPPYSPMILKGIAQLERIFRKAIDDNYMTLCYYLYSSLRSFHQRFHEVNTVCDTIMDVVTRNVLLCQLSTDGIGQLRVSSDLLRKEEIVLHLMLINHVFELTELFDVLLSILTIAESEQFLVGDDGRSIHQVGLEITFEDGERDQARKRILFLRKEIHSKNYFKLSKLIRKSFNPQVRNAFSHSDYRIVSDGILLTRYGNRLVSNDELTEMFHGAYSIQEMVYSFIQTERERFITNGGYEECGTRIEPVVEGDWFSVRISGSSPGGGPTGRVRQERAKKES